MPQSHVRDLVREHRRDLGGVVREREEAAGHVEPAVRQREGVDHRRVEDRDLIGLARPLGGRHEAAGDIGEEALRGGRPDLASEGGDEPGMVVLAADGARRRRRQGRRAVEEPAAGQAEDGRHGRRHPARADPVRSLHRLSIRVP